MDTSNQSHKSTPKDVFSYFLMYAMLYVGVVSFIALIFQYVNWAFPDVLDYTRFGLFDTVRRTTATLIVVWPVYLALSHMRTREESREPLKRDIKVRKWLLHLTLFAAALTIIVDVIALIYNFLGGELTIKFFLKIITILVVTGAVFGYYLWDLRRNFSTSTRVPKISAWVATAALLATIIAGFFIIGTPADQRARRLDEQRVQDLQTVQWQIVNNYWIHKGKLPENLDDLKDDISGFVPPIDPDTGSAYEYRATGELAFELCATFGAESMDTKAGGKMSATRPFIGYPGDPAYLENWAHGTGRTCFERTIDPELYKRPSGEQKPMMVP